MSKKVAGVILTGAFVMPHAEKYETYIDYMGRSEAVRNEAFNSYNAFTDSDSQNVIDGAGESMFEDYANYMSDPLKTKSLFNDRYNAMPVEAVMETKKYFTLSQESKSPMWQMVFSFRNEWLVEHGLLNPRTNEIDETKIYHATREAMGQLIKKEGLEAQWLGSVHYNTKHIHVHIGMTEKSPTREWFFYEDRKNCKNTGWQYKGKFLKKNITAAKSKFVNSLLSMQGELIKVDEKMSGMVDAAKRNAPNLKDDLFKEAFDDLYRKLPKNRSRWTYGYAKGQKFKTELDGLVTMYLNAYAQQEFNAFINRVKPISDTYEEAYGNPKNKPTYLENKLYGKDGLYHTLGNVIMKELKKHDKEMKQSRNSGARLTIDDLQNLKLEEQCVRSELPPADALFESDLEPGYDYYMENLLSEEPPEMAYGVDDSEFIGALENFEELKGGDPVYQGTVDRLKEQLIAMQKPLDQIADELFSMEEKERTVVEKRGILIHADGRGEPATIIENRNLQSHLAIPSSTGEVIQLRNKDTPSMQPGKEPVHNINSFSKGNRKLILTQNPDATFVYGPNQWKLSGREVKASELKNPIVIQAPVFQEIAGSQRLEGFRPIPVYDISQTVESRGNTFVYDNQEGVKIISSPSNRAGGNKYYGGGADLRSDQFKKLMKELENSTQKYLNERAYKEMEYELSR